MKKDVFLPPRQGGTDKENAARQTKKLTASERLHKAGITAALLSKLYSLLRPTDAIGYYEFKKFTPILPTPPAKKAKQETKSVSTGITYDYPEATFGVIENYLAIFFTDEDFIMFTEQGYVANKEFNSHLMVQRITNLNDLYAIDDYLTSNGLYAPSINLYEDPNFGYRVFITIDNYFTLEGFYIPGR